MAGTTLVTWGGDGVGLGTTLRTLARDKDQPGKTSSTGMEARVPSWGCRLGLTKGLDIGPHCGVGGWR